MAEVKRQFPPPLAPDGTVPTTSAWAHQALPTRPILKGIRAEQELLEPSPAGTKTFAQPEGFDALALHKRRRPALFVPKLQPPEGNWPTSMPAGFASSAVPKKSVHVPALALARPLVTVAVQGAPMTAALDIRT